MARGKGAAILPPAFFDRSAVEVARDLIGASVVRLLGEQVRRFPITETEAYEGVHDLASHSSKGRTPRTEVMFCSAGRLYVYRVYGLHWMLNVVTGKIGDAAAVLIRSVEGVSGPGRVAAALEIDASLYGKKASRASGLWFEPGEPNDGPSRINRTARIGVDYAGPVWAAKKLRFIRV
jgi:DNA-3-methyladenine glycosylase